MKAGRSQLAMPGVVGEPSRRGWHRGAGASRPAIAVPVFIRPPFPVRVHLFGNHRNPAWGDSRLYGAAVQSFHHAPTVIVVMENRPTTVATCHHVVMRTWNFNSHGTNLSIKGHTVYRVLNPEIRAG